ncbi:carbohydrate kinase family protein [Rathayibacter soli]|uniref:carbohydrate kinase family protein n=1 Tax=Rathayibacter soli TaxID=3144168 RepID=UPI0027E4AF58|nr:PfkB family carbohydrate kinase [Glaciibacter superstes]
MSDSGETTVGTAGTIEPAEFDVFLAGPVFMDIVLSGMEHAPVLGTESWAESMGTCPGGIANVAVALSRLGLSIALATAFGDDAYGDFCRESLELSEGIDISRSVRMVGKHTPVTVSLAYDGDRTLVSHGHPNEHPSVGTDVPRARAVFASVESGRSTPWLQKARDKGARVVLNSGWDASGRWDLDGLTDLKLADVFVANQAEAMAWTRTTDAVAAVRKLAELVPLAVVTRGPEGVVALDRESEAVVTLPGMAVKALDPTGAGDIFLAGLICGLLMGRPLRDALVLGCLSGSLSVERLGGSFSAPTPEELQQWYREHVRFGEPAFEKNYGFLSQLFPHNEHPRSPRRTIPTVGFRP